MKIKTFYRFLPILLGLVVFGYFYLYKLVYLGNKRFKENSINERIIDSNNWPKRSTFYYLKGGLSIELSVLDSLHLKIGDSISKEANTTEFNVYRKNNKDKY
ncbi:hypothetical protein [Chryseobacterium sediminis]|uniref:Uncharacterized protein n=1 Tax=Chryseobacterium sediminis TaxID=1679494 RepID=A0A5B2U285_9FLAO|nr:hypothetical protein [Chryseobacterium sediminis]KAA2220659.1 hypothetical protein FW780_17450 [Chryseobacterium sediminis]